MEKVTYASLNSLSDQVHRAYEAALTYEQKKLGRAHPLYIRGQKKKGQGPALIDTNPADTRMVLGKFESAGREETRLAMASARAALVDWLELGWEQRVAFLRKAAALMTERQFRLAALLTLETGKNRSEALAEITESIDLLMYYCRQMELHRGFTLPMAGTGLENTRTVLKPYGVWAVVCPFNSPFASAAGMAAGALVTGNTVLFKPSSDTPLAGLLLYELFHEAGMPVGVINFLTGPGALIGEELLNNPDLDGLLFSGSREVGLEIIRRFQDARLRPCVVEMGGKNPVVVMPSANLDDAVEGVLRSAFGGNGQKSSACSRLYLHRGIYQRFIDSLAERVKALVVGDPVRRETILGPLINQAAVSRYDQVLRLGRKEGRVVVGGSRLAGYPHGFFVEPTILDQLPPRSLLFRDELFLPVLAVRAIESLAEAIQLANGTEYGLAAGIYTQEEHEQETFFDAVHAGVVYSNRRGGATTGAWPGVQSFGGWKESGNSGKGALGPYYLPQFMREQSQTRVRRSGDTEIRPSS